MNRGWYWKVHGDEYKRFKVGPLPQFCGWDVLLRLIEECDNTQYYLKGRLLKLSDAEKEELRARLIKRDKALIATAFETGGRITEVLRLRKSMFTIESDRVIIKDMPVVKRWEKVREIIDRWQDENDPPPELNFHFLPKFGGWVKRKFVTKPVLDRRNTLEIPRSEPLTPFMVGWVEEMNDWIFPQYAKNGNPPMTITRAYQIVRELGERIGLHKYSQNGEILNQHVCNHWFRSQRASQLASEYDFREFELKRFFGWKGDKEAILYAKLASTKLFDMMQPKKGW